MCASTFDFMNIWTQSDMESEMKMKKVLLDGFDAVVQVDSDVLSMIEVGDPISAPVVRWMEQWDYPSTLTARLIGNTLLFSGYLFGKTVNADAIRQVVREGTILESHHNGCIVKVASLEGLQASVTPYGNTISTGTSEPVLWDIIAEAWSDYRNASNPRSLDRMFREVGTQIFAETFEIPKTRKNTAYEKVRFEVEHQIEALLGKLRRQLAASVIRSRPFHDGSQFVWGDKTDEPSMCGLCTWPIITQRERIQTQVYMSTKEGPLSVKTISIILCVIYGSTNMQATKGAIGGSSATPSHTVSFKTSTYLLGA